MSLIASTSALALGGIVAAVVAGWSQVKNAFAYVSSFVVVTADLDEGLSTPFIPYLRQKWRLLPSGLLVYRSRYIRFTGTESDMSTLVPFRVPAQTATYIRGWRVIFIGHKNGNLTVSFLRGTTSMNTLIREALAHMMQVLDDDSDVGNRYQVIKVVGREKGAWANSAGESTRGSIGTLEPRGNGGDSTGGGAVILDINRDPSFMYDASNWVTAKDKNPFEALYYPEEVEKYIAQAQQWLHMREWYRERRIPWRRGWLLYGPPGTGKTSLSKATAQYLRLPIYQFFLSTLSDLEMIREWEGMTVPCIALLEDFDAVFDGRVSTTEHKSLTFDCVLNLIGGVGTADGVFLMVNTNHLEKIDPAMGVLREGDESGISTRPGRIDSVIHLGFMSAANRLRVAQRILVDWPESHEKLVAEGEGMTPVQFQELCVQYAYARLTETYQSENVGKDWNTYCKYSTSTGSNQIKQLEK